MVTLMAKPKRKKIYTSRKSHFITISYLWRIELMFVQNWSEYTLKPLQPQWRSRCMCLSVKTSEMQW